MKTSPEVDFTKFCPLPWTSLEATTTGIAKPCCKAADPLVNNNGSAFNFSSDTISEVWNSAALKEIRNQFLNGEQPKTCQKCWDEESAGYKSKRQFSCDLFTSGDLEDFNFEPSSPIHLDLKLGNICNLKCRTCATINSSSWAEDELKLDMIEPESSKKLIQMGKWTDENKDFWSDLEKVLPNIKSFDFSGGEPFLVKPHFELLKKCVEKNISKNIVLNYNTNGTIFNDELVNNIWPNFKRIQISISIDGVGKFFELLRHPASWDEVINNIEKFKKLKNTDLSICCSVSSLNVYSLDELINWANLNNYPLFLNPIHERLFHSIRNLPEQTKSLVIEKISSIPMELKSKYNLNSIIELIKQEPNESDSPKKLLSNIKQLDTIRNERFDKLFPDFYNSLKSNS
jgi:MoaA/NifB/PqqE/SkfB family radical SAM enzyme